MHSTILIAAFVFVPMLSFGYDLNAELDAARSQWGIDRAAEIRWDADMNSCDTSHGKNPQAAITAWTETTLTIGGVSTVSRSYVIHVNQNCDWSKTSLLNVILHEYGHVLGLGHSNDPKSVMFWLVKGKQSIRPDDRLVFQSLAQVGRLPDAASETKINKEK
jgi:hypothetical protein